MRTIVATAILVLIALLASLIVYIILRRAWALVRAGIERRRLRGLEVRLDDWLASGVEPIPETLTSLLPYPDRFLFSRLCVARLRDADDVSRVHMISWLDSARYIDRWIAQLSSRSAWRRAHAAEALGVVRIERSLEPLIATLKDPVFDVRMRAARALGAVGGRRARAALIGTLTEENRWSVIRIADLLSEMGREVPGELIEAYRTMSRAARLASIELIAQIGDSGVTPFLLEQLEDLDRDVRARAAAALGRIGDGRAIPGLRAGLKDAEWPVRAMCAKGLGSLFVTSAVAELRVALRDREWWVRANAADALRQLGPVGLDTLANALDDADAFARDQALATLEESGELNRRLSLLCSTDPVEAAAARSLVESLVARQPRRRFDAIRDRHPLPEVRRAIAAAEMPRMSAGAAS